MNTTSSTPQIDPVRNLPNSALCPQTHQCCVAAALLLEAFVNAKPDSNWIKILFKSVNKSRVNGKWTNTQSNCWAALALDRYFKVMEGQEPKFTAHSWLDEGYVGSQQFKGRSTTTITTVVPISFVLRSEAELKAKAAQQTAKAEANKDKAPPSPLTNLKGTGNSRLMLSLELC